MSESKASYSVNGHGGQHDHHAEPGTEAPRQFWGFRAADVLALLQNAQSEVVTMDSRSYKGELAGVDQFNVVLKDARGELTLIPKHAVKLIRRATAAT